MHTRALFFVALFVGCDTSPDDKDTDTVDTGEPQPVDADGDGFDEDEDCDDDNAAVFPGADEVCDGLDNDCDDEVDGASAIDAQVQYPDADADGYGDPGLPVTDCGLLSGYVEDSTDCDDTDADINPAGQEICDADDLDEDCDDLSDDADDSVDASTLQTAYADTDGDGYGDSSAPAMLCDLTSGYVLDATDCDDTDPEAHALSEVTELVYASETVSIAYNNGQVFRDDTVRAYTYGSAGGNDDLVGWSLFSLPEIDGDITGATLNMYATTVTGSVMINVVRSPDDAWTRESASAKGIARDEVVTSTETSFVASSWSSFALDLTAWDTAEDIKDGAITLGVDNTQTTYSYVYFNGVDSSNDPHLELTYEACD